MLWQSYNAPIKNINSHKNRIEKNKTKRKKLNSTIFGELLKKELEKHKHNIIKNKKSFEERKEKMNNSLKIVDKQVQKQIMDVPII